MGSTSGRRDSASPVEMGSTTVSEQLSYPRFHVFLGRVAGYTSSVNPVPTKVIIPLSNEVRWETTPFFFFPTGRDYKVNCSSVLSSPDP